MHDIVDFSSIITDIRYPAVSIVTGDKGYDSEDNRILVREQLHALSIIAARYGHVAVWKPHGRYRKQTKRGYSKLFYSRRNKDETILSIIKRLFGVHITSQIGKNIERGAIF